MAKRIHIQHFHTTTATTIPDAVKTDLYDGEIGLVLTDGSEKIFFNNSADELITISSDDSNNNKFAGKEHTHARLTFTSGSTVGFNTAAYQPSTATASIGIVIPTKLSHLTNDTGTITGITAGSGLTGGGIVLSGETGVTLNVGAGTGISVSADTVAIDSAYQNRITSGVTAYGWGNHADAGYAKDTKLTSHTSDNNIHVTAAQKTFWTDAATRFNTFISGDTNDALDTLVEIQEFLSGDTTGSVSLISKVNENTNNINTLSKNLSIHSAVTAGQYTAGSVSRYGHVTLVSGDLKNYAELQEGLAASHSHTHSQYLTSETYKGTISGVTAGGGLTGGGTVSSGSTVVTLSHGDTSSVDTGTTFGSTSNVTGSNGTTVTIPNFKVDGYGHVISAGTITYTSKDTDTKVTSVGNHYTPASSTTKNVNATEIITGLSMDAAGHVTAVNKGSYTIAKSVPSDAVFTDTHHTGKTIVTSASTATTTASTVSDNSVRLNHIENGTVRSSVLLKSDSFCNVKGTAGNEITFSVVTGTSLTSVARGDHSHSSYVNQNAFSNVVVNGVTIAADTTTDTLALVAGESIVLTPDTTNDKITIAITDISCGTF